MNDNPYPGVQNNSNGKNPDVSVRPARVSVIFVVRPRAAQAATACPFDVAGIGNDEFVVGLNENADPVIKSHRKSVPCSIVIENGVMPFPPTTDPESV
jgi:hypothetical protein